MTHECAVCMARTTKRCSRCHQTYFCSTRCQALLWPLHEHLCTSPHPFFTLPPLTTDEAKVIEWWRMHSTLFAGRVDDISEALRVLVGSGLWSGPLPSLVFNLRLSESTMSEPSRSWLLILLRQAVFSIEKRVSGLAHRPTAWQQLSHLLFPLALNTLDSTGTASLTNSSSSPLGVNLPLPSLFPLNFPHQALSRSLALAAVATAPPSVKLEAAFRTRFLEAVEREVPQLSLSAMERERFHGVLRELCEIQADGV